MALTTSAFWNLQKGYKPPAGDSAAGVTSNKFYLAQGASAVPPTGVNPIAAAFWGSGSQSILTKDPFPQPVVSGGGGGGGGGEQPESVAYSKLVLAASPVMYLKCNENTGSTLTDSTGNGHDGTTEVPLEDATAADLNPDNKDEVWAMDYGAVNLDAAGTSWGFHFQNPLELGAGKAWTVEFLFQYYPHQEADGYLLQLGAAGNGCPGIVVLPTTDAGFKVRVDASGQRTLATGAATYSMYTTYILHLIQHADGSPTQLLIDGVEALSFTHVFGEYPNGPSTAGHANPWGYPSVGYIDEFALYQKALTPADIAKRVAIIAPTPAP